MSQETNRKLIKLAKREIRNCKKNGARVSWKVVHQGPPETRFNLHKRRHKDSDECKDMVRAVIRAGLLEAGFFSQREDEGMVFFVPSGGASAKEVRARVRSRRWVGPALVAGGVLAASALLVAQQTVSLSYKGLNCRRFTIPNGKKYKRAKCTCNLVIPQEQGPDFCPYCSDSYFLKRPRSIATSAILCPGPQYPGKIMQVDSQNQQSRGTLISLWIYMSRYIPSERGFICDPSKRDLIVADISTENRQSVHEEATKIVGDEQQKIPEIIYSILLANDGILSNHSYVFDALNTLITYVDGSDKTAIQTCISYAKNGRSAVQDKV